MIKYHSPGEYWDQTMLKDILSDPLFEESETCFYIVPGEYAKADEVNTAISRYEKVVLFITSDECSRFEVEKIDHPNIEIWVMYPKQGRHDPYNKLPLGYTPHTLENVKLTDKDLEFFFSGQVTHERREKVLNSLPIGGLINKTKGFTQGLKPKDYMSYMSRAKYVICPSGPVCADSFRLYEAIEAGAIPIADECSLAGDKDYFTYLFGEYPFPSYSDPEQLEFKGSANEIQAWWLNYKRDLKNRFLERAGVKPKVTVVVPVSPIKSHPSTEILDKCIASIRHHLDAEIIITFDGVRAEQENLREAYTEFIRRALALCNEWGARPILFSEHTHQVGMMRKALGYVKTPHVLYVEGDTGLVTDKEIDFEKCYKLLDELFDVVRFHFEGEIPQEHKELMIDETKDYIRTLQWSQRPHIARTDYYKWILSRYFTPKANSFIEDKMHSVVQVDHDEKTNNHHIAIYKDDGIKYSVDFDGREGDPKYENVF